MNKKTKIIISIVAVIVTVSICAGVFLGASYSLEKKRYENAQSSVAVIDQTYELDNQEHEIKIADVVDGLSNDITAQIETGQGLVFTSNKVMEESYTIVVTLKDNKIWSKFQSFKKELKISVIDTTAPTFTESVDEIKIVQGNELNILDKFKAEDLSGGVELTIDGNVDNHQVGEQLVRIIAADKNGNITQKEIKVIVEEKAKPQPSIVSPNNSSSGSNDTHKPNRPSSSVTSNNSENKPSKPDKSAEDTTTEKIDPKKIQEEINKYIASKGWEVNSSLTPSTSGWSDKISIHQSKRDIISSLKYYVDEFPPSFGKYCYYDGHYFYVLYD